jgi:hypothetical protein
VVLRHGSNIQRLINGTEGRFEFRNQRSEARGQKSEIGEDEGTGRSAGQAS